MQCVNHYDFFLCRKAHLADQSPRPKNVIYGPGSVLPPGAKYPMPPPPPGGRVARKYDENEYALIWELQSSGNDSGKGIFEDKRHKIDY